MELKFNINGTAPNNDTLAQSRQAATDELANCARRYRWFKIGCFGIGITGQLALLLIWQYELISADYAFAAAAAAAVAFAGAFAVAFFEGAGAGAGAAAFAVAVAGAFAVAGAAAGAAAAAVAFAGAFAVAAVVAGAVILYDFWINTPRTDANQIMTNLVELDASLFPEQCIQFMEWVESDQTIKVYQHQLAILNRKPVLAEYAAAEKWVKGEMQRIAEQDKIELAQQACSKMSVAG